jgi:alpha-galactosidase
MSDADIAQISPHVEQYHAMEDLVLHGDLYRLSSPFDSNIFGFGIVSKDKSEAHITAMQLLMTKNCEAFFLRLDGLDPNALYEEKSSGARYHGSTLMNIGLFIDRNSLRDLTSITWHFVRV